MFKTGDRAKVLDPHETLHFSKGDIVEVVKDSNQKSLYVKRLSDGTTQFIDSEDLEKMGGKTMKITGLSEGDEVTFRVNGKEFTGEVTGRSGDYFLNFGPRANDEVFLELGLNAEQFCEEVCGVETHGGDWPEVETLEELETVVNCLQKEISKREGDNVFKVGDRVRYIGSRERPFCSQGDTGTIKEDSNQESLPVKIDKHGHVQYLEHYNLKKEDSMKEQETFPVRITSAQKSSFWYAGKIGEVFNVAYHTAEDYQVVSDGRDARLIKKTDCTTELYDRIEDIQVGDHIEILRDFGHPAIKAGHILEATEDRKSDGDIQMKYIKGTPRAGKEMPTHPFPMVSKDQVKGKFRIISKKEAKMSAKETLINFMMKKQARLGDSVNYFDWKDAQAINSWPEDVAQGILDSMSQRVSQQTALTGADACPFCYKHDTPIGKECKVCEWGSNHGICDNPSSDYRKAKDIAERHGLRLHDLADMLRPSKPATLKQWEDRLEDDHPEQAYIRFDDAGPDDSFRVYICNKDGKRWMCGTLVQIHPKGLYVNDGVDAEVSRYIKMDGDRLHMKD